MREKRTYILENTEEKMNSRATKCLSVVLAVLMIGVPFFMFFNKTTFDKVSLLWMELWESVVNFDFNFDEYQQVFTKEFFSIPDVGMKIGFVVVVFTLTAFLAALCSAWMKNQFGLKSMLKAVLAAVLGCLVLPALFPLFAIMIVFCLAFMLFSWLLDLNRKNKKVGYLVCKILCGVYAIGSFIVFPVILSNVAGESVLLKILAIVGGIVVAAVVAVLLFGVFYVLSVLDNTFKANLLSYIVFKIYSIIYFVIAGILAAASVIVLLVGILQLIISAPTEISVMIIAPIAGFVAAVASVFAALFISDIKPVVGVD